MARGRGWTVHDVVCSCGPQDRPYDERHDQVTIAIVTAGSFQYRGSARNGRELMTPGSLLLGSPGQCFECGHEHGVGDRCLSFSFAPEYFEVITAGIGRGGTTHRFRSLRLPPVRMLSPVIADACAALVGSTDVAWEELGIRLAAQAVQADGDREPDRRATSPAAVARVTRTVRKNRSAAWHGVDALASRARGSTQPLPLPANLREPHRRDTAPVSVASAAARRGDTAKDRSNESD